MYACVSLEGWEVGYMRGSCLVTSNEERRFISAVGWRQDKCSHHRLQVCVDKAK